VSVKDSSATEHIINGGFSSISSWNQTCSISSCASIGPYGPGSSQVYLINCVSSTNYYTISQTFASVACMNYTISFAIALDKVFGATAHAYAYIY
jgi:hypothetical protein